jgi:hypothetical protein
MKVLETLLEKNKLKQWTFKLLNCSFTIQKHFVWFFSVEECSYVTRLQEHSYKVRKLIMVIMGVPTDGVSWCRLCITNCWQQFNGDWKTHRSTRFGNNEWRAFHSFLEKTSWEEWEQMRDCTKVRQKKTTDFWLLSFYTKTYESMKIKNQ